MLTDTRALGQALHAAPAARSMWAWCIALAMATVFAIDCFAPRDFELPFLYVLILWVALARVTPVQAFTLAAAGSTLTLIELLLSPEGDLKASLANRTITLFALWFLYYFGTAYRKTVDALHRRERELTDLVKNARLAEKTSERKKTELRLREHEKLLQATFDSAPVGIFMADLDGRFVKANAAYQLMVGYSAEELLHTSVHRLTHPDDVHQNRVLRQELVTGKREFYEIDKRYCSRDGRLIWVRNKGSLIKDALGGPRYMIVVSQDITERKMAEEALRRSREMFAALVNSVDGIVWEADARTFRFTFVSQQAERLLGYPVERWLNESGFWKDHIHPDDRDWAVDFCVAATREKRAHDFEYRMLASDGRTVWVRDLVTVVVEDGQAARLRGIIVDITGYKAADRALQESERRLRLALEEREHLSRDLHDHIIQAIYAIGMQLETCQRSLRDDPKEPAIQLARVITGLNGVMHDMRRYLSGSESRIPDEPRLDVELVKLVKTIGATGTLRFRLKLDPAVIAQLNPEQAEHLLHVAREAMGNALRHSRARHARLSLQDAGAGVRLEIRDDGVGFDPRGVKRDSGGLHNMECRARQLGGRFEVLSSPGGGAAIILVIPKGSAVNDTQ